MDDWAKLRNRLGDLVDAEVSAAKTHAERIGRGIKENRASQRTALHEVSRLEDIEKILEIERIFLVEEREIIAGSPAMETSLNNAIVELDAASRTLELVRDPETYGQIAAALRLPKNRIGSLPRDDARQFFKSHLARLGNLDRGRLSDSERSVLSTRAHNVTKAQSLYIGLQEKALDIDATQGRGQEKAALER